MVLLNLRRTFSRHCSFSLDDTIGIISLERTTAKNALGRQMIDQLTEAIEECQRQKALRAVIVQSLIPGVFCAGADLKERLEMPDHQVSAFVDTLRSTFNRLEDLPVPTIAAIDGVALGGGLELAMACDMRIASPASRLGLPEVNLAIFPAAGGSQRLPLLVGPAKARELVFRGCQMTAAEALKIGLLNELSPDPFQLSLSWAREISAKGPLAVRAAKASLNETFKGLVREGMAVERAQYDSLIPTEDRKEGLAAFSQKRKPIYRGC